MFLEIINLKQIFQKHNKYYIISPKSALANVKNYPLSMVSFSALPFFYSTIIFLSSIRYSQTNKTTIYHKKYNIPFGNSTF